MARLKPPEPPTPQQMPRFGIDTIFFTKKQIFKNSLDLLPWLQTYIDPDITEEHLEARAGNGFYRQCISISTDVEDPRAFVEPFKRRTAELLRISFDPRAQTAGTLYPNETTAFHLNGELLRRIDYIPILKWIKENRASVTRLDMFKDDFSYFLNMDLLHKLCSSSCYSDHVQSPLVKSYLDIYNGEKSIYLGNKAGKQIHIYDKGLQVGEKFQHVRAELKSRRDNKFNTGIVYAMADGAPVEPLISSLISKYVTFKPEGTGRIHDRQPYPWWTKFIESATPIKRKDFIPVSPKKHKVMSREDEIIQELNHRIAVLEGRGGIAF